MGCGQGSLSLGFAALVALGQVVGVDIAEASIAQAHADLPKSIEAWADSERQRANDG